MFRPGSVITRREVLHDELWLSHPVTVVADEPAGNGHPGELAVLLRPGAEFTFPDHPFGAHPWAAHQAWSGPQVLQVMRPNLLYAAWFFFDPTPDGPALRWTYLNFESALERMADGYATADYGIDLIIHPDGRREWKDVEDLHGQLASGRVTAEVALAVLAETAQVVDELATGAPWWSRWLPWRPPSTG